MFEHVEKGICADSSRATQWIHYLSISRQLERIADHAVNIAEDVAYLVEGEIVRHGAAAP